MDRTEPFYIEVITGSYIRLIDASFTMDLLEYSYDKVNWYSFDIYQYGGYIVNVNPGDKVYMRAKSSVGAYYVSYNNRRYFTNTQGSSRFNVGGNIMSLLYGDQFTGNEVDFPSGTKCNFYGLFEWFQVVDASKLILPATTLTIGCYNYMFASGWSSNRNTLVKAPAIIQATIPSGGFPYEYMFKDCNGLESLTIENTNIRRDDYILYNMSPKTIVYKKEDVTTPRNPNNLTVVTLKNTLFNAANAKKWVINNKEVKWVVDSQNRVIWKNKRYTPFYVENTSDTSHTLTVKMSREQSTEHPSGRFTFSYAFNIGSWTNVTLNINGVTEWSQSIPAHSRIYFASNESRWYWYDREYNLWMKVGFGSDDNTGSFKLGGNIMSLVYGTSFTGNEATLPVGRTFDDLFSGFKLLTDASELLLPATTLANSCYFGMFEDCSSLRTAPELPATTLANGCYFSMFAGCSSLAAAPALPATTLVKNCYSSMFAGCSSLAAAPALPATTLEPYCYSHMFKDCSSLTTAPALPATTLTEYCYGSMFSGCSSLRIAPALPATRLTQYCYDEMFYGCRVLNNIKCLATNIYATDCLVRWVYGVSSSGTFTKKSGVSWPSGASGIPSGWTVIEV